MIELSLPREQRIEAKSMLKVVRDGLDQLLDTSPKIPDHTIKEFKERFDSNTDNLSKPGITNGLDPIYVYTEGFSPDPSVIAFPSSRRMSIQPTESNSVISRVTKAQSVPQLRIPVQTQPPSPATPATPQVPGITESVHWNV
jgi:hypothetical protein